MKLLATFMIFTCALCFPQLLQVGADHHLTFESLVKDPRVSVRVTSQAPAISHVQYFMVQIMDKTKTSAHFKLKQTQTQVFRILRRLNLVALPEDLVKTRFKPEFLSSKRKWLFRLIFAVSGTPDSLQKCTEQLSKIGVLQSVEDKFKRFLSAKSEYVRLFETAYSFLQHQLRNLAHWEIAQVDTVLTKGGSRSLLNIIENQLEGEFSESDSAMSSSQLPSLPRSQKRGHQGSIGIVVTFKLTNIDEQSESEVESEDEEDSESVESDLRVGWKSDYI